MPNALRKKMNEEASYEIPEMDAVRQAIIDECQAVIKYNTYMDQAVSEDVVNVLASIRDEEKVHVGELMTLLVRLNPEEAEHLKEGHAEVRDLINGEQAE